MPESAPDVVPLAQSEEPDGASDYGSDFSAEGEALLDQFLENEDHARDSSLQPDLQLGRLDDEEGPRRLKLPRMSAAGNMDPSTWVHAGSEPTAQSAAHGDQSSDRTHVETRESRKARESSAAIEEPVDVNPEIPDNRSPLERFRTKPKKSLSVTDLISPSWCELQYWYTLTKHGKKRQTPAMKQGSSVHKTLEEQVHITVPVEITRKEDSWGLRLWNVIQGLRTLRDTGMTRELEIWGVVEGIVVNGVIDELNYVCPDRELEASAEKKSPPQPHSQGQATITDFLGRQGTLEGNGAHVLTRLQATAGKTQEKIYLTDVKTRSVKTLPRDSAFRPTLFQLMSYRRLLSDLATDKVDADIIFDRYDLEPDVAFSDAFVAQVGSLNSHLVDEVSPQGSPEAETPFSTQDSLKQLLGHNSLRALWTLMIEEFGATFPRGSQSIGSVLKAEYREPAEGKVIGAKTFLYDDQVLDGYLAGELQWWRGERAAQGVRVEEAFKCGHCEFAEGCSWRKNKIEDAVLKMRERQRSRV